MQLYLCIIKCIGLYIVWRGEENWRSRGGGVYSTGLVRVTDDCYAVHSQSKVTENFIIVMMHFCFTWLPQVTMFSVRERKEKEAVQKVSQCKCVCGYVKLPLSIYVLTLWDIVVLGGKLVESSLVSNWNLLIKILYQFLFFNY